MTSAPSRALRADIQALRAVAVGSVVLYHLWPHRLPGGFVGVDVFFVISGFLITGQLLGTAAREGRVRLLEFWKRRAVRLLPSSLVVLLATAVATVVWVPQFRWEQFFREIGASTLYVQNWLLARDATDYLASTNDPSAAQHFWSLSVEEQFYLAIPILIAVVMVLFRARWRLAVGVMLAVVTLASFGWSLHETSADPSAAYFVTTTRAWEFGVGGLLAYLGAGAPRRLAAPAAWAGIVLVVASAFVIRGEWPFPGWAATVPVAGTALVLWARRDVGLFEWLAALPPVQWLGEVSYAVYLWHFPLVVIVPFAVGHPLAWPAKAALVVVTLLLAWVTTTRFEEPIRFGLARRTGGRRIVLIGIAVAMVAVIGGSAAGYRSISGQADLLTSRVSTALQQDPACFGAPAALRRSCPPATELLPPAGLITSDQPGRSSCMSHDGGAALEQCSLGPKDATRIVAAIGDSHMWALAPALETVARGLGWRIDLITHTGCPWSAAPRDRSSARLEQECVDWVAAVDDYLTTRPTPYDAIITTHKEALSLRIEPGVSETRTAVQGLLDAWAPQEARGSTIIALTDYPVFPRATPECIARHGVAATTRCAVDRSRAVPARDSNLAAVGQSPRAIALDLRRDIYCPARRCSPVVGGVPMLFDNDHITRTYSLSLGGYLTDALERVGRRIGTRG